MVFIFSFFVSYWNNETYKIELTQRLLKNMNLKLDELQSKWKIKTEEILPKFKKDLSQLRDTYKEADFEYDVIQELINNLTLEKSQKQTQENQNSENTNSLETQGKSQEQQNQTQIQPKWPSMKIDEEREDAKNKLSLEEQKQIEDYIEWLKLDEQQNINLNKPQKSNDLFDILRDDFFFEWFDKNENWW